MARSLKQKATLAMIVMLEIFFLISGSFFIVIKEYFVGILLFFVVYLLVMRFSPRNDPDLYKEDTE